MAIALLLMFLFIWRPRIGWPRGDQQVVYAKVQLPRSVERLRRGFYLQIFKGGAAYYPAPEAHLQRWNDSKKMGSVYVEGFGLKGRSFRELTVGIRISHMGHWSGAMSIELFRTGKGYLLLFWGSRACGLKIPDGARYVVTAVPTHLFHLREFSILPLDRGGHAAIGE